MQSNNTDIETNDSVNMKDLVNVYNDFVGSFSTNLYGSGIVPEIDEKTLQTYMSNPDKHQKEIEKIMQYYYISNPDSYQLYDMTRILPTLNYKINSDDESNQYDKNIKKCNAILKQVKHKTLTRDLISQLILTGTLVGIFLGDSKNPYFYTFDNLEYVFPAFRKNGEFVAWVDLKYLDTITDTNKRIFCESLYPYISMDMYNKYKKSNNDEDRFIELPEDRTVCIRTHYLHRNQRYGLAWGIQGLSSVLHKKKLKDMEKSLANMIMNEIVVLKLGNKDTPNDKLNKTAKKKVYSGVKDALDKNNTTGLSVIGIPDWSSLEMLDIKNGDIALDPKKFDSINDDISTSSGLASTLLNGKGSNYASSKLNLEIFYKRIGVLLEDIEYVYNKLFDLILPKSAKGKYTLDYDKFAPLSSKEVVDVLSQLHFQEGFSLKALIDTIGLDFDEFIRNSDYEQNELKIQSKIKPYASAFTGGIVTDNNGGAPIVDDPTDSTIRGQDVGANNNPE